MAGDVTARAALDAWRFLYMPMLATPGPGRWAGSGAASPPAAFATPAAPADVDAFVGRLEGERGRATERLYRSFFLRELPAAAARPLLGAGPDACRAGSCSGPATW